MDIHPGDVLEMKKEHPCGARRWQVLRVGGWTSACAAPAAAGKSCCPARKPKRL